MKARSLSCACLFTVSTLLLAAPAMAIKPVGPNAQPAITAAVQAAVDSKGRTPDNVKRDAYRHPAQTLSFFGVEPGKTVVEITPGGGWYSEILAPLLRDKGTYVAAVVDPQAVAEGKGRDYQQRQIDGLKKKFDATPGTYDKAKVVPYDPNAPKFGVDNSADVVLTFRNVHNWRSANQAEGMFKGFYSVLKPGGVLGVVNTAPRPTCRPTTRAATWARPRSSPWPKRPASSWPAAARSTPTRAIPRTTRTACGPCRR